MLYSGPMSQRIPREDRLAMARRFEQANISKDHFCKAESVSMSTLDYWRHQLRVNDQGALEAQFVELVVDEPGRVGTRPPAPGQRPDLEVQLPLGVKLRFFGIGSHVQR